MSSLWTPGGEQPVGREGAGGTPGGEQELTEEEYVRQMQALQQQLAETPAAAVVANHCYGLFELAALHLSLQPPQLGEAQVAIDALAAVVEGLTGRLGEHETQLKEGLAQLRLAFVQIRAANLGQAEPPPEPTSSA
ncbi:MAG TPA: hypothetical protein VM345_01750 [Acidimicrobiales bacterium]|jgi:hypothetical protein|nr:hypothetical protein [Acidimicrobiales bacterium]